MYRAVRRRKQRQYMHQRMADIDKLASKDMAQLYRVFGWRRHSACSRALLSQHAHWQSKLGGRPEPRGAPELLEEDYPGGPVPSADALNAPVTTREVCDSLHKMTGRKAAGIDGMPAELLKSGPISMMEHLASLFTAILNGKHPEQLSTGVLQFTKKETRQTSTTTAPSQCWPSSLPLCSRADWQTGLRETISGRPRKRASEPIAAHLIS